MDGVQLIGMIGLAVVLVLVAAIAILRTRFDGRLLSAANSGTARRSVTTETGTDGAPSLADVGISLPASQISVVQFSGEFCAVCPQARTLVERVLRDHPDISHVEIDVAEHLEVVRALGIRRTPTLLIVDRLGRAVHRASGMPREPELRRAIADLAARR